MTKFTLDVVFSKAESLKVLVEVDLMQDELGHPIGHLIENTFNLSIQLQLKD